MLFTWDTTNLCIVFRSWRVTNTITLLWSLFGVMLLTAGYELVRELSRRYDDSAQQQIEALPRKFFYFPYLNVLNFSSRPLRESLSVV